MSAPPLPLDPTSRPPPQGGRSLWRELSDGSAGWPVRVVITLALAALLTGACLIGAYLLAAMMPQLWDRGWRYGWSGRGRGEIYPDDELVAWLFVIAGLFWLAAVAWIWSRNLRKHRALWYAAVATLMLSALTIVACVLAEQWLTGDDELVVGGIACLGGAVVLLMWVEVWRRYGRGRPVTNEQDGLTDVRCPTCGYRMVGLYESRCPECGTAYTLEDLLGRQEFVAARADRSRGANGRDMLPERPAPLPPVPTS